MTTRRRPDRTGQDGSAPIVEMALGAPIILVVVMLVIWAGSGGQTPGEVDLAAQDAARQASTIRTVADRPAAANRLVSGRLDASACATSTTSTTSTDTTVTVTVTCRLATDQMAALRVPPRTVTATGRSSIDPYFLEN